MAIAFSTENVPSNQVLAQTPDRARTFLVGISRTPEVKKALEKYGLTDKEITHGWSLLQRADGFTVAATPSAENVVKEALDEIDAWGDAAMRRAHAALTRLHPEQDGFVFAGLEPKRGTEAIVAVTTFLDRLAALEDAPERKSTRKADQAALATLELRGIDKAQCTHIRKQIKVVQTPKIEDVPVEISETMARRTDDLVALRRWYEDWAETARTVITKREHRIRIGLAKRRRGKSDASTPTPPPAVAAPAPTGPLQLAANNPSH